MPSKSRAYWGLAAIAIVCGVILFALTPVDLNWTTAVGKRSLPVFEEIMGRSIFEGEGFGANDPVILLLLGAVAVYYIGWRVPGARRWAPWRPHTGFILAYAVIGAVYFVHALKWVMGRARPDLVLKKGFAFSHWYAFGPHFVTDGVFHGAVPSGHTSQMFILMTVAYVLAGNPLRPKTVRWMGLLWGVAALALSLAMGMARCLTLSHWLTDVVGSIAFGWLIMHLLYFHILRVPHQQRFMAEHAVELRRPPQLARRAIPAPGPRTGEGFEQGVRTRFGSRHRSLL